MGWKMTKEAALKRQKAERLFEEGFGPLKVSRELEVNFWECLKFCVCPKFIT